MGHATAQMTEHEVHVVGDIGRVRERAERAIGRRHGVAEGGPPI
jgi:hypothetical protein